MATICPAHPDAWRAAFELVFAHLSPDERQTRVENALRLVGIDDIDPEGILTVRVEEQLVGAFVCVPLAGAGGLVWPPSVLDVPEQAALADQLVQAGRSWLRRRGAKVAQALLTPAEAPLAAPLERNDFTRITQLQYLRHDLADLPEASPLRLSCQMYEPSIADLFHQTLLRTYEDTLDCPELNGTRTIDEIIAGHKAQGEFDPGRWWLAWDADRPIAVLMLTKVFDENAWDLSYVGVVPEARGRGVGGALTQLALRQAQAARVRQLTLAVD